MKIQIGEVYMDKATGTKLPYPNKTKKYLLPCLRDYGDVFLHKINNVFKVAVGIGDMIVYNSGLVYEKHLFILLDSNIATTYFTDFILWIREQPMFEDDYTYGDIQKSSYHMVILKFPEKYNEMFHTFKQGKYSEMFAKENLPAFLENYPDIKKILIKDQDYRIEFVKKLNTEYNLKHPHNITPEEWVQQELDFPPTPKTEVFNHHLKR